MREHPVFGAEIAARMAGLDRSAIVIIYEHHQRFDGSGLPERPAGSSPVAGQPHRVDRRRLRRHDLGALVLAARGCPTRRMGVLTREAAGRRSTPSSCAVHPAHGRLPSSIGRPPDLGRARGGGRGRPGRAPRGRSCTCSRTRRVTLLGRGARRSLLTEPGVGRARGRRVRRRGRRAGIDVEDYL